MPYAKIGKNSVIDNAIIAEGAVIEDNCTVGELSDGGSRELTIVGYYVRVPWGTFIKKGLQVDEMLLKSIAADGIKPGKEDME
jgi:ADP-glucose pyrophosphorylase